jgi:hypothetical protein
MVKAPENRRPCRIPKRFSGFPENSGARLRSPDKPLIQKHDSRRRPGFRDSWKSCGGLCGLENEVQLARQQSQRLQQQIIELQQRPA